MKGTLQAKLDLSGTSQEPRAAGGITIANGAFKSEDSGVTYSRLDGKIDFQSDRVHITDLHVLDNDNQSLSLTGDLGVNGLQVSAVNLGIYADNFKVLGNETGNLRVSSNLELTGTLAHPKLQGELDVTTGNVNLDPIIAKFGNTAYSTTTLDTTKAQGVDDTSRQGLLGGSKLAVHTSIPDDLVIKADDLKTANGPVGLGKVNLTLGGDLNIAAAPGKPVTLVGSVNTVRGFYDFQGRRFTVLRDGKVQFQGDPITSLDPSLDVSAERMIQAVTARVNVRGRLRKPEIELTSTPPQDQADILALIVFNQPLNQLGEGQQLSLAQRAGSMAAGAVANQLTGSIANSLNLDQFEINLSPDIRQHRRADRGPAARTKPVRQSAAGHRRQQPDKLCARIRILEVAAPPDQRPRGRQRPAATLPAREEHRRRPRDFVRVQIDAFATTTQKTRETNEIFFLQKQVRVPSCG